MSTQREWHRVNAPLKGFYAAAIKTEVAAFSLFSDNKVIFQILWSLREALACMLWNVKPRRVKHRRT